MSGRWVHLNIPPSDFEVDHLGHDEGADAHPAKPANAHELHQAKAKQTHRIAGEEGRHVAIVDVAYEPENDERQRSEEHTSELQSLMCISYAVFCLKRKQYINTTT